MQLNNLKIGTRLIVAFSTMVVLIVAMVGVAVWTSIRSNALTDQIINEDFQKSTLAYDISDAATTNLRLILELMVQSDAETIRRVEAELEKNRVANAESIKKLEALIRSENAKKMFSNLQAQRQVFIKERNVVLGLVKSGDKEAARIQFESKVMPVAQAYLKILDEFVEWQKQRVKETGVMIDAQNLHGKQILGAGLLLAIIVAVLSGSFVTRSIVNPLRDAVSATEAVSKGNLDVQLKLAGKDEVSQLLRAMQNMVGALKSFSNEQLELVKSHDAGQISARMDTRKFGGDFAKMAESVNALAQSHIDVQMRLVEVVKQYAAGDLSKDMDRLPGEKARISEAMDGVKASLKAVNAEIQTLVEAASQGNFKERGDEQRFQFAFREMVVGLNRLMAVADDGLSEVARMLNRIAAGDLTEKIDKDFQGTFAQLRDDANRTVEQLSTIVSQINEAAQAIGGASSEIASGNSDLSSRTEEQASSLEETASSMEELTGTVKQNAENAKQANQLAVSASDVAKKGGDVVNQVVDTMGSISASAKKIEDIISVIDGIAFQTNILALNAAVEAARAGEQGRGFAVVASEVRNLAQRSGAAAKEIKDLIGDSVGKVESGSKLVNEAGQTMDEVVKSVKRVADIISEITAASMEQSAGIEQVNQAIAQMDQTTQQNAALVEEAAAAAESMEEQARGLVSAMAVFKLAHNGQSNQSQRPKLTPVTGGRGANEKGSSAGNKAATGRKADLSVTRSRKVSGGDSGAAEWKEI